MRGHFLYTVTVLALSETLIYMLVVLIELLQPTGAITVDYLQDSSPAMVVQIVPALNSDNDLYLLDASAPSAPAETVSFRVEQSDLYAHNYVVFPPGSPPVVLDLSPVRRWLASASVDLATGRPTDFTLELGTTAESPPTGETAYPALMHLLIRPPYVMLAAGAEHILLIAR